MQNLKCKSNWLVSALLISLTASTMTAVTDVTASAKGGPPQQAVMHATVMPLSEGSKLLLAVSPPLGADAPVHYWKPSAAEIRRLEADMPRSLTSYYRQYLGVSCGKTRLIMVNGFSSDVAKDYIGGKYDWHQSTVSVMDGGMGFFHATYDPQTRKFTGPHFNGVG